MARKVIKIRLRAVLVAQKDQNSVSADLVWSRWRHKSRSDLFPFTSVVVDNDVFYRFV